MHQIQQAVAKLAGVASAQRDVGEKWDQRRLEAVGKDDGLVVVSLCQLASEVPARAQLQLAVRERRGDHFVDLGHGLEQRGAPGRSERVYGDAAWLCLPGGRGG